MKNQSNNTKAFNNFQNSQEIISFSESNSEKDNFDNFNASDSNKFKIKYHSPKTSNSTQIYDVDNKLLWLEKQNKILELEKKNKLLQLELKTIESNNFIISENSNTKSNVIPFDNKSRCSIKCRSGVMCELLPLQKCKFQHSIDEIKQCVPCSNYLQGKCKYGSNCKFAHIE